MLSSLDALHVSAVLEDCVDQLEVLGHIMPSTLEGRPDANKVIKLHFCWLVLNKYNRIRQGSIMLQIYVLGVGRLHKLKPAACSRVS